MPAKKHSPPPDEFLPIWFKLKPSFYTRLKSIATNTGVTMPEALVAALRQYEQSLKAKPTNGTGINGVGTNGHEAGSPAALSELRWRNVPAEERQKIARDLAEKRWAKKRIPKAK